jgi:predicted Zn-dependent protease
MASKGKLTFDKAAEPSEAQIRIHWVTAQEGLYGEAVGGDVYVRPETGEGLLREAIVYLTCLHETGHALGLRHTSAFADIMYSFQYGGDIQEYFDRYRRQLVRREDIRKYSGMSDSDRRKLQELLDHQR